MEMEYEIFGNIEKSVDSWIGEVLVTYPHCGAIIFKLRVRADAEGPSNSQREIFEVLTKNYELLWPEIAKALVKIVPKEITFSRLMSVLNSSVGLSIPGIVNKRKVDFLLSYSIKEELPSSRAYFIGFLDWKIDCAFSAA